MRPRHGEAMHGVELTWDPNALPVVGVVCATTCLFAVLRYLMSAPSMANRFPGAADFLDVPSQAAGVLVRRCVAGCWLGGGTLAAEWLFGAEVGRGLSLPPLVPGLLWVLAPMLVIGPILWRSGKLEFVREEQPEIRDVQWTPRMRLLSMGAWVIFLTGYEYLFRGGLLFTLEADLGVWAALAVSSALYALAHLHKPLVGETLSAVPIGFLFGAMTLSTGSFLPAVALHCCIAFVTELSASRSA
jgi:membrane protease YdiL (CAAX protease family)